MSGGKRINNKKPLIARYKVPVIVFAAVVVIAAVCLIWWNNTIKLPPVVYVPSATPPAVTDGGFSDTVPSEAPKDEKVVVYRILFASLDSDNYNTDTIMVVNLDITNREIGIVSIPRDTYIESATRKVKRINGAYAGKNIDRFKDEVETVIGFEPDYYIIIDMKGFVDFVDLIGGVDFDVPIKMDYDDDDQNLHIHYGTGMQHLKGQAALEVMRFRVNNDGTGYNDYGRMKTQQEFLKVAIKKALTIQNFFKLPKLPSIYETSVMSDLTWNQLLALALEMMDMDSENITTYSLPSVSKKLNGSYYEFIEEERASEIIEEIFG